MVKTWSGRRANVRFVARAPSRWRRLCDLALTIAILGLLILLSARLDRIETRRADGRAVINDGDSITLAAERIRLRGLDAPELNQVCRRQGAEYPCGRRAREALVDLIDGRPVACAGWERDRYARLLASCTAGGRDINRMMVESGWAVAYGQFEAEEQAARQRGAGLWGGSFDRPRAWRDQHGGMAESEHGAAGRILNWLRQMLRFS